jgi:hypothetical protein
MSVLAASPAPPAAIPDRTFGPDDLARLLNASRWRVLRWRRLGVIPPGIKLGKTVRWTPADVAQILAAREG